MDEAMSGGRFAKPVRRGDTVERRLGSLNSHALLRHFEQVGFTLAPRFLGASQDTELLGFIEGKVGYPPLSERVRSEEALISVARAIRAMHDATEGFTPVDPDTWRDLEVAVPARIDCIGHHDLSPWNIVFDGDQVVGLIDWDTARPSNRAWDLSYAAYQFTPLYPPAWLEPFGWPAEPGRAERLKLFTDTYGMGIKPAEILDLVVVRLSSFAAYMEDQIRAGNPNFAVHRDEQHADGLRASIRFIVENRAALLT